MLPGYDYGVVLNVHSSLFANLTLSITPSHALMSLAIFFLTILSSRIGEAA